MKPNLLPNNSPEYLKLLLESSNEGIFACDNQFNITYKNRRLAEIHAYPEDVPPSLWKEYIQLFETDGVTPTSDENVPIMKALRGIQVRNQYHILKRKGLESILVKYSAHPLFDEFGKQVGAVLSCEDCRDMSQSIARFRAIFEQSPLSIQILDRHGKTLLVNSAFQTLWGISDDLMQEYILGKYNILQDPVLINSGRIDYIRKAFQGEAVIVPEFLYDPSTVNLPGRSRWTVGVIYPLKNSQDEVYEIVIIHTDVTEQKEASMEHEKILSQMEGILRQLPAGLMVTDLQGRISLYNDQMRELIGEPAKALDVFRPILEKSIKGSVLKSEEVKVPMACGGISTISTSSGPIYDSEGNITSSILISSDVTQEKKIENNQTFLAGVKSILTSIIDYDQILEKIAASAIPYLADGCMVDILEGDQIKRIVTKHRIPAIQKLMEELQNKYPPTMNSPQPTARAIRTGRGELLKNVNHDVIKAHTFNEEHSEYIQRIGIKSHIAIPLQIRGKVIGALNLFISETRPPYDDKDFNVALELGRHASVAIDNAKLYKDAKSAVQLRDDFISIASHELRTPITSLNLQIEVLNNLIESLPEDQEAVKLMQKFFGNTKNQLKRLTRLVDDMLDISRISTGKLTLNLRRVNMKDLIQNVVDRFKDQLKASDIACEYYYHGDVFITSDAEKIDQVVTNFMTNAIRYGQRSPIHISLDETENSVVIQVKDHGRGISVQDQERIFKRFERAHTDEDVSGLGLGLYINTQIVREHQGTIKLVSELGLGSNFIVELPKVRS